MVRGVAEVNRLSRCSVSRQASASVRCAPLRRVEAVGEVVSRREALRVNDYSESRTSRRHAVGEHVAYSGRAVGPKPNYSSGCGTNSIRSDKSSTVVRARAETAKRDSDSA